MADDVPSAVERGPGRALCGALLRPDGTVPGPDGAAPGTDSAAPGTDSTAPRADEEAPAPATVTLAVLAGPAAGTEFAFTERVLWLAGRAAECRLRLPRDDQRADRFHCLFEVSPPHVRVRDLGTAHGTFVNGEEVGRGPGGRSVPGPVPWGPAQRDLADGDEVRLGATLLRVAVRAAGALPATGTVEAPGTLPAPGGVPPSGAPAHGAEPHGSAAAPGPAGAAPRPAPPPPGAAALRELLSRAAGDGELTELRGYRVVRELGRGRHGVVCLARHRGTGTQVALKLLQARAPVTQRARAGFMARLEQLRGLRHPGILRLYGSGAHGTAFCVAVEYAAGGTLEELLAARGGTLPPGEAVGIALQVLDALASAHATPPWWDSGAPGYAHLDVKPSNILLTKAAGEPCDPAGPAVKLGDFGIAAAFDRAGLAGLALTGVGAGPAGYLPRVRLAGEPGAGPEVDVWATAAVLYRMLSGTLPREVPPGADPLSVLLREPPVPLRRRSPAVPRRLAQVVDAALIDSPRIVTAGAREFRAALSAIAY